MSASFIGCGGSGSSTTTPVQPVEQAPTVSSIAPAKVSAGAGATTLTVNGTGFLTSTVIKVGQNPEATTYVSATQVTASIPANQLASGTMLAVVAVNGSLTSSGGAPINLEVDNPAPVIASLTPAALGAGASATTLTVAGTGFVSTTVVNVNGTARATAFVSPTQVSVSLATADLATAGSLSLTAVNPSPGGGTSAAVLFPVNNPSPGAITVQPNSFLVGANATTIVVTGSNFSPASTVQVGGSARTTTYVSPTQLSFPLTASDLSTATFLSVTVTTPAPGGGTTAAATITINDPTVGAIQLSPSTLAVAGASPAPITITGNTFVPASVIQVNGTARATTFVNASTLTFVATVADQATSGTFQVTVTNPAPGGGTSPAALLTVGSGAATPVITSITQNSILVGSPDTAITVKGTNFSATSKVQWNGVPLSSSLGFTIGGTVLVATVPAAQLAAVTTASVTVYSPNAVPPLSNALPVSVGNPSVPTLSTMTLTAGPINTAVTLSVSGSGFVANSTINFNGIPPPPPPKRPTYLTAIVPASSLATPGVYPVTVSTPAPGGGTSTPLYFTAYVAIANNSMVYNPVNGLFYLSVPSAVGPPYGNTVVSVDPLTGAFGTPIPVGSEPDQLAITSDGKYLWVALDGASAIRKVDLAAGTAGLQFPVIQQSYGFAAASLAALPGATDSVVVSTTASYSGQALAIYDSGVVRGTPVQATFYVSNPWALVVDGTRKEIYAGGSGSGSGGGYATYTYDATGLTLKATTSTTLTYANQNNNEMQIIGGRLYTDFGQVEDAESGGLLGSFYSTGTTPAAGSTTVDSTLGRAFVLEGSWVSTQFQLQAFDTSTFSATSAPVVSINAPAYRPGHQIQGPTGMRLTRWGSDGLAFRSTAVFVSLRTSMVRDLSTTNADLAVALTSAGAKTTGTLTTYTATVTNNGPSSASSIQLLASIPSSGELKSVASSIGSCSTAGPVICDLGSLANAAKATVVFSVFENTPGSATMTVQVSASENDPAPSNNQASSTITITGSEYALLPTLSAITPQAIASGSPDTIITVSGANFINGSNVLLNGASLATSYVSDTEMTAIVPAADLARLGWAAITVTTPAPGGGISAPLPLTVFSVLTLGVNHILYDPYSRKIMASVSSGSSTVAGNSIVAINPETASIGTAVPVAAGTPTGLALTSDGQILYALVPGTTNGITPSTTPGAVARFNMLTQQPDFSVSTFQTAGYNVGLRDIATQPGFPNTIALDEGEYTGNSIVDFDPATKTATKRGNSTGTYTGTCLAFPNPTSLFALDLYSSPSAIQTYSVTSGGLVINGSPYTGGSIVQNQNCYKLSGNLLYTQSGGISSTTVSPMTQVGVIEGVPSTSNYGSGVKDFDPDTSLGLSFYLTNSQSNGYAPAFDGITGFSIQTFMPVTTVSLPFTTLEGGTAFSGVDVVRWGQDGLAVLTSGGHIYLVRGAAIVPQLLSTNSPAVLTAGSFTSISHGAGNTDLTLTGSNFSPGVAVTWNGGYRTTTIVDATHVEVAIPASDLVSAGTASVLAINPGAAGSSALTITIN